MSDDDALRAQAGDLGVFLGPPQLSQLRRFEKLLADRAVPLGAISRSDAARIRERHTLDSLRAVPVVEGVDEAADLGSGAGLPGVVVAIALPRVRMLLIERRPQRAAFLELAVEDLGLGTPSWSPGGSRTWPATWTSPSRGRSRRSTKPGLGPWDPPAGGTVRLLRRQRVRDPRGSDGIGDPERRAHARA
jgi:hypothetical protein